MTGGRGKSTWQGPSELTFLKEKKRGDGLSEWSDKPLWGKTKIGQRMDKARVGWLLWVVQGKDHVSRSNLDPFTKNLY